MMRIRQVEPFVVSTSAGNAKEAVIVRVSTDSGVVGWGEAATLVPGATTELIRVLGAVVEGSNPLDIGPLWERMYATMRPGGHADGLVLAAMSAVDIALWDIAGKALGVPVAKLLGGRIRDAVPVYASGIGSLEAYADSAAWDDLAVRARRLAERGYRAIRVELGVGLGVGQVRTALQLIREAVGPEIGLIVDAQGAFDLPLAKRAGRMMEAEGVLWMEEPLMGDDRDRYAHLAETLQLPVTGARGLSTRWAFNGFLAAGALDLVQPEVARTGGISESKRIADLADVYDVPFAPRVGGGTAIARAASLQMAAAGPNLRLCEWPVGEELLGDAVLSEAYRFDAGLVHLSDVPGLGLELDESLLLRDAVSAGARRS